MGEGSVSIILPSRRIKAITNATPHINMNMAEIQHRNNESIIPASTPASPSCPHSQQFDHHSCHPSPPTPLRLPPVPGFST
mmetsp:Transcript_39346/g.94681  ORF Transcript_39346/g.94681 Transcript_39346/m.94681 type:complete len:81 (-) Transcript_39346:1324-1566(-)